MKCDACREQMLPFLYDLLEPFEREAVVSHLERCSVCSAALVIAQDQQAMLADAVKEKHADIVFKAPSKATPASSAPTLVMQRPTRRLFVLNRWAMAAAVLLVLFGGGSAVAWSLWREQADVLHSSAERLAKAKEELSKTENDLKRKEGQTQAEIRAIQEQIDALFNNWKKEETKTRKVLEERGAQLIIKGPQNVLAGANNNYEVEFRPDKDTANKAMQQQIANAKDASRGMPQLQVRAFNQRTNETLYQQELKVQGMSNTANFVLPSNIPIKPGDDLAFEFQTQAAEGKLITLTDNIKLIFPEYVTHLATDRPRYRPGETVRFRSLTLERFSLKPAQQKFHLRYRITGPNDVEIYSKEVASTVVAGAKNEPIKGPNGEELHCLGAGEFALPANLAPGQFALHVSEVNDRFKEEKRTFTVKHWQPARFRKEVQFDRKSYGPGDQVKMQVRVVPALGLQADNLRISVRVVVDGTQVLSHDGQVDRDGKKAFEYKLPKQILRGVGTVTLDCHNDEWTETLVRELPLAPRDMQIEFFPEGGELVAGTANRVYFQARTPANRPVECTGRIVDEEGEVVARLQTLSDDKEPGLNQGLGVFAFVPQAQKRYRLIVDSPVEIGRSMPLPAAKEQGLTMTIPEGVRDNEIVVDLMSVEQQRELLVGAYCRGRMLDHKVVRAGANQPVSVILRPDPAVGGVYRVTVFETVRAEQGISFRPLAERLVYRKSSEKVDVTITSDRASYQAGDAVRLTMKTRNERKASVPTIAMVAVADSRVLKLANETTARGLATHFRLSTEVRNPEELEYADVLLGNHPKAATALDLLLGCQGWRRFAEQNPQRFQEKQPHARQANFLANTDIVTQFLETEQKQLDKVDQDFVKQAIEMQKKLAESEKQGGTAPELAMAVGVRQSSVKWAQHELAQTERHMTELRGVLVRLGLAGAVIMLLLFSAYFISVRALSWFGTGISLVGAFALIGVVGFFILKSDDSSSILLNDEGPAKMAAAPFAVPAEMAEPADFFKQGESFSEREDRTDELQKSKEKSKAMMKREDAKKGLELPLAPQLAVQAEGDDRFLRKQGNYQAVLSKSLGRRVQLPPVRDPSIVREYAHRYQALADNVDHEAVSTLYWHPVLVLPDGKAQVQFDLPDTGTRFQVLVHSLTLDGRLGTNRAEITTSAPHAIKR